MTTAAIPTPRRFRLGTLGISVTTMGEVLHMMLVAARARKPAYVCVANIQTAVLSQQDAEFCRIENESLLTLPDGMPLVWYARMAGVRNVVRITGPDVLMEILRMSREGKYTHYFYGDTEETLRRIREVIQERYPGTVVLGTCSPPFRELTDAEMDATVAEINRLQPSFVWVGLGCPKQERWIGRVISRIDASVLVGVGAAFRFLIGEYRHPPRVFQACGLEGIFWRGARRPGYCVRYYARHLPTYSRLFLKQLGLRLVGHGEGASRTSH
jgi:N-acetylglucosaminyldiphosphoundecaprenol N-acetyl-beta-D-mannosaminyltransferase